MNRFDESSEVVLFSERFSFMLIIRLAVKVKLVLRFFGWLICLRYNFLDVANRHHSGNNANDTN
jgi:hypothetical protein